MIFGKLAINPARSPAILDTATWDPASAWGVIQALDDVYWQSLQEAFVSRAPLPASGRLTPYAPSWGQHQGAFYGLAGLADGQQVFIKVGIGSAGTIPGCCSIKPDGCIVKLPMSIAGIQALLQLKNYGFRTKILSCGRFPRLFGEVAEAGTDICTMRIEFMRLLYEHPFTDKRMNGFLHDWQGVFGDKTWPEKQP